MRKIIWKKPLGILVGVLLAWLILPNSMFWGFLVAGFIILLVFSLIKKKTKREVKVIENVSTPKEDKSGRGSTEGDGSTAERKPVPERRKQKKGTGRKSERGRPLQKKPDESADRDKPKPGSSDKADESDSIAIPDVEPIDE